MQQYFESLVSMVVMDEDLRGKLEEMRYLDERVYDCTLSPSDARDYIASMLAAEVSGGGVDPSVFLSVLDGTRTDDSAESRLVSARFSEQHGFPWSIETVCEAHRRLYRGSADHVPGSIRGGSYVGPRAAVDDRLQAYPSKSLFVLVDMVNLSPFYPQVSSLLFWNGLEMLQPFYGDNEAFHIEMLVSAMRSRGFTGAIICPMCRYLRAVRDDLGRARLLFLDTGDPNPMLGISVDAVLKAYRDTYEILKTKDIKKQVDGISRSIIRHSRALDSFTVSDAATWLGDISDQTFRTRIAYLIDMGVLIKKGKTKGVRYSYIDPLEAVWTNFGGNSPYKSDNLTRFSRLGRRYAGPIRTMSCPA